MTNKFFVYGTLKVGGKFAGILDSFRREVQVAKARGFDLYGVRTLKGQKPHFPAAVKGTGTIIGEIHEFDDTEKAMYIMDNIEGYDAKHDNGLFLRQKIEVELLNGTKEEAFMYTFNRPIGKHFSKIDIWKI